MDTYYEQPDPDPEDERLTPLEQAEADGWWEGYHMAKDHTFKTALRVAKEYLPTYMVEDFERRLAEQVYRAKYRNSLGN